MYVVLCERKDGVVNSTIHDFHINIEQVDAVEATEKIAFPPEIIEKMRQNLHKQSE